MKIGELEIKSSNITEVVSKWGVNWDIDPNLPNILADDYDDDDSDW